MLEETSECSNKMKLHIYIFRHGETYFNRDKKFTGWKDSKLTPKGIRDSKKIAKKLKNKRFEVAYQTRLSRSKDTLKYVLRYHPECKEIITDDRMIERNYGKLQGQSHEGFIKKVEDKIHDILEHGHVIDDFDKETEKKIEHILAKKRYDIIHRSYGVPPSGGESIIMVEKRVLSFIKDLKKFMKENKVNIAISAHGNSMRPFRRYFERLTVKQMMKLENPWDDYFEYIMEV